MTAWRDLPESSRKHVYNLLHDARFGLTSRLRHTHESQAHAIAELKEEFAGVTAAIAALEEMAK